VAQDSLWFRQDTTELEAPWLFFLSSDAFRAWVMLKMYVKRAAVSQKAPNRAQRMDPKVAAHTWRVTPDSIQELEAAALDAGALTIEEGLWIVTDKSCFQSPRSAERDLAEKRTQTSADEREDPQTNVNDRKGPHSVTRQGQEQNTDSPPTPLKGGNTPPQDAGAEPETGKRKREAPMVKPEAKEVADYFRANSGKGEWARQFFDYYTSNGWKVGGRAPMKDWQAAARKWIREEAAKAARRGDGQGAPKGDDEPRKPEQIRDYKSVMARSSDLDHLANDPKFAEMMAENRHRDVAMLIDLETKLPWDERAWRRRKWPDHPIDD